LFCEHHPRLSDPQPMRFIFWMSGKRRAAVAFLNSLATLV
jgi:hypothetical protein